MFANQCLQKLLTDYDHEFLTVLDVGSGPGDHADLFRKAAELRRAIQDCAEDSWKCL